MSLKGPQSATTSILLDEALRLDEAGRRRWLEALPSEYQEFYLPLREALLGECLEGDTRAGIPAKSDLQPGTRVGPYELIRLLGAGGMAEVWLAKRADGAIKREVALKLPLRTRVRRDLEQRFARERDILAGLEHPHIARLYDAGVGPEGLPYLAMEYVQGQMLTDWCDTKCLDLRERLRLFLQVLEAVQHAQDRHVIHRDLKPSNILVTDAGQVRLLDFGVATLLATDDTETQAPLTSIYGYALTPVYASPELMRGDPVDAKSDIYSLGVVLFELLTGNRPYRLNAGASRGSLEQAIEAAEIHRPSTQITQEAWSVRGATHEQLARQLRGDLDLIVLKALSKQPEGRYASAAELADDIERYLAGRPVKVRPSRLGYRLGKFTRRNRTLIAVSAAAVVGLVALAALELPRRLVAQRSEKSIAVLPFLDMSEKGDQGYFSDGLSEELISSLAQIRGLEVIARTSSFHFRGKPVSTAEIAATLHVANVLEGSVRRVGNAVRVTTQLIRAESGVQLWSQTYERDVKDIFQVQDEIAAAVVAALKLKLLQSQVFDPHRSDNPEAYNQFLLARQFGRRGNPEDTARAVAAYRTAIALDPGYAAAYAGLAFTETAVANYAQDAAGFARARDAAEKAMTLAPQLADAYRARALLRLETLDFAGARADSEQALALAPGESAVQSLYAVQIAAFGRISRAIVAMNKAIELDPLNSFAWANLGLFLTENRDYALARGALERASAISPSDSSFHFALGQLDLLQGRLADATAEFERQGSDGGRQMGAAMVEHAQGHEKQSQRALDELIQKHADDMAYQVADVYAWLNDDDEAFKWLERAYRQRDSGLNGIAYDPLLTNLQTDLRFGALLKKLGL